MQRKTRQNIDFFKTRCSKTLDACNFGEDVPSHRGALSDPKSQHGHLVTLDICLIDSPWRPTTRSGRNECRWVTLKPCPDKKELSIIFVWCKETSHCFCFIFNFVRLLWPAAIRKWRDRFRICTDDLKRCTGISFPAVSASNSKSILAARKSSNCKWIKHGRLKQISKLKENARYVTKVFDAQTCHYVKLKL